MRYWMLAAAVCLVSRVYGGEPEAPPVRDEAAPPEAKRPDTAANRALDQTITAQLEGQTLEEVLQGLAGKGVQYVTTHEVMETEIDLFLHVKDMPMREVLQMLATVASLDYSISPSGLVALRLSPEERDRRRREEIREEQIERMREREEQMRREREARMREHREGPPRHHAEREDGERRPPPRHPDREEIEDEHRRERREPANEEERGGIF